MIALTFHSLPLIKHHNERFFKDIHWWVPQFRKFYSFYSQNSFKIMGRQQSILTLRIYFYGKWNWAAHVCLLSSRQMCIDSHQKPDEGERKATRMILIWCTWSSTNIPESGCSPAFINKDRKGLPAFQGFVSNSQSARLVPLECYFKKWVQVLKCLGWSHSLSFPSWQNKWDKPVVPKATQWCLGPKLELSILQK